MSVRITKNNIYLQIGIWKIKKIWDKCQADLFRNVENIFLVLLLSGEICPRKHKLVFNFHDFFLLCCYILISVFAFFSMHKFTD